MKVICDRAALADAVGLVQGVVANRTPTPVLLCIKLVAADGRLSLTATDGEIGLELTIDEVEVGEDGAALVPADKLSQIIRAWDQPSVTLDTEGNALHIRSDDAHFKVFGFDPAEAPPVRDFADREAESTLPAAHLRTVIHRTLFAAAAEHSRYAINGVLFERDDKRLRLVATDGRRLAVASCDCTTGEGSARCIVPLKALALLVKLASSSSATVSIVRDENQILFRFEEEGGGAVLSSNLVEGTFPPFEDVIPKDQDKRIEFDTDSLNSAIRRAALLTNEESRGVRLKFADKRLTLSSRAPEMGEATIQLDLPQYDGEELEIGFNPGFITDALKVVDSPDIIIELKAPNKPGVLRMGRDFTYVIMPVNLQ